MAAFLALAVGWYAVRRTQPEPRPDSSLFHAPGADATSVAGRQEVDPAAAARNADYREGEKQLRAGNFAGAVGFLRRAVDAEPGNALYRVRLGDALRGDGNLDDARREYEAVLAADPNRLDANRQLGTLLSASSSPAAALPYLQAAAAGKPDDLEIVQEVGWVQERTGDRDAAAATYRDVIAKFPEADVTRSRLAEVLVKDGHTEEAIAVLGQGLAHSPNVPRLHRDLGFALEHTDRSRDAAESYRAYLRLAPNAGDAAEIARRADLLEKKAAAQPPASPQPPS